MEDNNTIHSDPEASKSLLPFLSGGPEGGRGFNQLRHIMFSTSDRNNGDIRESNPPDFLLYDDDAEFGDDEMQSRFGSLGQQVIRRWSDVEDGKEGGRSHLASEEAPLQLK